MPRNRFMLSSLILLSCSIMALGFGACSGDRPTSSEPALRSDLVPPVQTQDVEFPIPPLGDFCGGASAGTILDVETDAEAGLAYSSNVFIPSSGGRLNIYFANLGPGSITFVPTGAFSVEGTQIPRGVATEIALTPKGSSATFYDGFFGGTFPEGSAYLGCVVLNDVSFRSEKHKHGTAHLDMSILRAGVPYTVRVNIHSAIVTP